MGRRNTDSVGMNFGSRVDRIGGGNLIDHLVPVPSLPGLSKPNDLLATGHRAP